MLLSIAFWLETHPRVAILGFTGAAVAFGMLVG